MQSPPLAPHFRILGDTPAASRVITYVPDWHGVDSKFFVNWLTFDILLGFAVVCATGNAKADLEIFSNSAEAG